MASKVRVTLPALALLSISCVAFAHPSLMPVSRPSDANMFSGKYQRFFELVHVQDACPKEISQIGMYVEGSNGMNATLSHTSIVEDGSSCTGNGMLKMSKATASSKDAIFVRWGKVLQNSGVAVIFSRVLNSLSSFWDGYEEDGRKCGKYEYGPGLSVLFTDDVEAFKSTFSIDAPAGSKFMVLGGPSMLCAYIAPLNGNSNGIKVGDNTVILTKDSTAEAYAAKTVQELEYKPDHSESFVTYCEKNGNFKILIKLLKACGVYDFLNTRKADGTFFAPTDHAFMITARDIFGYTTGEDEDTAVQIIVDGLAKLSSGDPTPLFEKIFKYHTLKKMMTADQISHVTSLDTILGPTITRNKTDGLRLIDKAPKLPNAEIQTKYIDYKSESGIIHHVSRIMFPFNFAPAHLKDVSMPADSSYRTKYGFKPYSEKPPASSPTPPASKPSPKPPAKSTKPSIIGILSGKPEFSCFVKLVKAAGAYSLLDNKNSVLTLFAPTNHAFMITSRDVFGYEGSDKDIAVRTIIDALAKLGRGDPTPLILKIFKYHTLNKSMTADQISHLTTLDTVLGTTITRKRSDGLRLVDKAPNLPDAEIQTKSINLEASNGFIHYVSRIMFPFDFNPADLKSTAMPADSSYRTKYGFTSYSEKPPASSPKPPAKSTKPSIIGLLSGKPEFSCFVKLVKAAGAYSLLDNKNSMLTLFAPTNHAFMITSRDVFGYEGSDKDIAVRTIIDALAKLGRGDPTPLILKIFKYHTLNKSMTADQISHLTTLDTVLGTTITRKRSDGLRLVDKAPNLPDAEIQTKYINLEASNGFIHYVSRIMFPFDFNPADLKSTAMPADTSYLSKYGYSAHRGSGSSMGSGSGSSTGSGSGSSTGNGSGSSTGNGSGSSTDSGSGSSTGSGSGSSTGNGSGSSTGNGSGSSTDSGSGSSTDSGSGSSAGNGTSTDPTAGKATKPSPGTSADPDEDPDAETAADRGTGKPDSTSKPSLVMINGTLLDYVRATPSLGSFRKMFVASGAAKKYAGLAKPVTIFAPTNEAFMTCAKDVYGYNGTSIDEAMVVILDKLAAKEGSPDDALIKIFSYHTLPKYMDSAAINASTELQTYAGVTLTRNHSDPLHLHDKAPLVSDAAILPSKQNIKTSDAIIHCVDRLMYPMPVDPAVVSKLAVPGDTSYRIPYGFFKANATATPTPSASPTLSPSPTAVLNSSETNSSTGTGSPTPVPDSSSTCFPANAMVSLVDGSAIKMSDLSISQKVLVGDGQHSEVFAFTHADPNSIHNFVKVQTRQGSLVATPTHYIWVNDQLKPAGHIVVGDRLTREDGTSEAVVAVSREQQRGLYNPQTLQGDIIVDGFKASTYTTAIGPSYASLLLAPVRAMYNMGAPGEFLTLPYGGGSLAEWAFASTS